MASAVVITVSDRVTCGEAADASGPAVEAILAVAGIDVVRRLVVADDLDEIARSLESSAGDAVDLVVTTGGTGFAPRDVTPEATARVVERDAPGLPELMRSAGLRHTPHAALSRARAGIRGRTLIVNLPGSPAAVRESLDALVPVLPHALALLAGETSHGP
ncbi:MAG: molybdenum cofactor biosynthesis protein B [Actinomycetota bacterium]